MGELSKLYIGRFIYGVGVLSTFTFTLYFLASGLTQVQISILFSTYFLATAILEIPTGGFADTYGHKTSFALGLIIESFYYLIFFLFPTFWGIFIGMLVAALGVSFQSGANDSLVYEMLKNRGHSEDFVKINGRISSFGDLGVILAAPIALLIYKYNHGLPYLISFFLVFISGIITSFVQYDFTSPSNTPRSYLKQVTTGVALTIKNKKLLTLSLISIVTLVSSYVMSENISLPLQIDLGIDVGAIGLTQSLTSIGFIVVGLLAYRIIRKIGGIPSLLISLILGGITLIALSQVHVFWGAGFIVTFMLVHSFRYYVLNGLKQEELTSEQRSTMASTGNMIMTFGAALVMPLWGFIVGKAGLRFSLILLALFILFFGLTGTLIYSKMKTRIEG